jgi:hypothetical protein
MLFLQRFQRDSTCPDFYEKVISGEPAASARGHFFLHTGLWVHRAPGIPHPLGGHQAKLRALGAAGA